MIARTRRFALRFTGSVNVLPGFVFFAGGTPALHYREQSRSLDAMAFLIRAD
jgi:hypothetical protein